MPDRPIAFIWRAAGFTSSWFGPRQQDRSEKAMIGNLWRPGDACGTEEGNSEIGKSVTKGGLHFPEDIDQFDPAVLLFQISPKKASADH